MMRKILFLMLIASVNSFAELINGPANIRDEVSGKTLFSLHDSVFVENLEFKAGSYKIGIWIDLPKSNVFKKGDKIYKDKKWIGTALSEIVPMTVGELERWKDICTRKIFTRKALKKSP